LVSARAGLSAPVATAKASPRAASGRAARRASLRWVAANADLRGVSLISFSRIMGRNFTGASHDASAVIPAERLRAREPGPKSPCVALVLIPGYLGPGSAPRRASAPARRPG